MKVPVQFSSTSVSGGQAMPSGDSTRLGSGSQKFVELEAARTAVRSGICSTCGCVCSTFRSGNPSSDPSISYETSETATQLIADVKMWLEMGDEADEDNESDRLLRRCLTVLEAQAVPSDPEKTDVCECGHYRSAHPVEGRGFPCLGWMPSGTGHHDPNCKCTGFRLHHALREPRPLPSSGEKK